MGLRRRSEDFLTWAERIGAERLRNAPALVAFNVDKRYRGAEARTVPTDFIAPRDPPPRCGARWSSNRTCPRAPTATGRFGPAAHRDALALIEQICASGRVALVQEYVSSVDERGEGALVFLGGGLSHTLRKRAILRPDEVAPTSEGELGVARAMLEPDLVRARARQARRSCASRSA